MRRGRAALALLALACGSAPASAQTFAPSPEITAAKAAQIDGLSGPILVWVEEPALLVPKPWSVVALYSDAGGGVARRVSNQRGIMEIRWLRVGNCPAFKAAVDDLARLQVGVRSPFSSTFPASTRDGTVVTVSSNFGISGDPPHALLGVEFTANGGPVANWAFATDKAIEGCWSIDPPKGVPPPR